MPELGAAGTVQWAGGGERKRPGTEGVEHGEVATGSRKAARQQYSMLRRIKGRAQGTWQWFDARDLHSHSSEIEVLRTALNNRTNT